VDCGKKSSLPENLKAFLRKKDVSDDGLYIKPEVERVSLANLEKMGVAKEYNPYKDLSFPLYSAKSRVINNQYLLIASYGDKKNLYSGIKDVYIKKHGQFQRVIHLEDGCNDITLIQLGKNGPALLRTMESGCGSGSGGDFYRIDKNGLTEVLHWGGWRGGTGYYDIDGNGIPDVFTGDADSSFSDDLENRLKKIKGFDDPNPGGPWMYETEVYQWVGDGFHEIGKFYEEGESGI
jgi:hypothetical protein